MTQAINNFLHLSLILLLLLIQNHLTKSETYQQSLLYIQTNADRLTLLSIQNKECYKCKPIDLLQFNRFSKNVSIQIDTYYPNYYIYLYDRTTNKNYCAGQFLNGNGFRFGENASYLLDIQFDAELSDYGCEIKVLEKGVEIYEPLIIYFSCVLGIGVLYTLARLGYYKFCSRSTRNISNSSIVNSEFGASIPNSISQQDLLAEVAASQQTLSTTTTTAITTTTNSSSNRMKSVDVFRGVCLAIMMFANFGAGGYSFLDHTPWNGINMADLVFPCFIFIMGVSIPLMFRSISKKQPQANKWSVVFKILKRTILLFLFGLYTSNSYADLVDGTLRIMGVLQRFSISYFFCAFIEFFYFYLNGFVYPDLFDVSSIESEFLNWRRNNERWKIMKNFFKEILLYPIQWLYTLFFAIAWVLLTFLLPVENCPTGYLGPGGLHENASHFNCTGGAAGHIDRVILGERHMYKTPTSMYVYKSQIAYDPEGLLGCLTSCVLTYLGVCMGHVIIHYKQPNQRIWKFLFYGLFYALIGSILCKFSINDGWIPINKNLWSLSFVLIIAGIAHGVLIILYLLIDLWKVYSGTPFFYLGRNSISIYICHILFTGVVPDVQAKTQHPIMMAYAFYWTTIWTLIAYLMDYKKVYFSL
jgi:heparan-alpha-glucosaminide N-acetyltransferase